jgi:hypothetical protein
VTAVPEKSPTIAEPAIATSAQDIMTEIPLLFSPPNVTSHVIDNNHNVAAPAIMPSTHQTDGTVMKVISSKNDQHCAVVPEHESKTSVVNKLRPFTGCLQYKWDNDVHKYRENNVHKTLDIPKLQHPGVKFVDPRLHKNSST